MISIRVIVLLNRPKFETYRSYALPEVVNLMNLEPGDKIGMLNGATAEVMTNPKDGVWIFARYLTSPDDPSLEGSEEMFFAQDIAEVLEPG